MMGMWMEKARAKMYNVMRGRYGMDRLSKHLYISSLVLLVFFLLTRMGIFLSFSFFSMIFALYRIMSKKFEKRRQELEAFVEMQRRRKNFWKMMKFRIKDGKTNKYFLCTCGSIMRVPKGRGKIEVTCPKCKLHTIRNT